MQKIMLSICSDVNLESLYTRHMLYILVMHTPDYCCCFSVFIIHVLYFLLYACFNLDTLYWSCCCVRQLQNIQCARVCDYERLIGCTQTLSHNMLCFSSNTEFANIGLPRGSLTSVCMFMSEGEDERGGKTEL